MLGEWIGPYQLESKSGWGGFSDVYRTHAEDGTPLVVKVAIPDGGDPFRRYGQGVFPARAVYSRLYTGQRYGKLATKSVLTLFNAEAAALRSAAGHRLPKLIDELTTRDGLPVLVMEELSTRWSPQSAPLEDFARLLDACADLRRGRDAEHRFTDGHGDLKPEHVFLDARAEFVFIDPAAYSTLDGPTDDPEFIPTSFRASTPEYNPRMLMRLPACDIFAVAVMIYQRYAGQLPWSSRALRFGGQPPSGPRQRLANVPSVPAEIARWADTVLSVRCNKSWFGPLTPEWVGDHAAAAAQLRAAVDRQQG